MTKQDSQLAQIRLMIEEIQQRQDHINKDCYSINVDEAREFVNKVAAIVGKPFMRGNPSKQFV